MDSSIRDHTRKKRIRGSSSIPASPLSFFDSISSLKEHCRITVGDLDARLDQDKGLTFCDNFLPANVAEVVAEYVESGLSAEGGTWDREESVDNVSTNDVKHGFSVSSGIDSNCETARKIMRVFHVLGATCFKSHEDLYPMFDFAKYGKGDHIGRHDDRAIVPIPMIGEDGEEFSAPSSRRIAAVLYLSREWKAQYGGALVDLESEGGPKKFYPQFNRLVVFRVPRWHLVETVKTGARRLSIFGWWLQPGVHYECSDIGPYGVAEEKSLTVKTLSKKKKRGKPVKSASTKTS